MTIHLGERRDVALSKPGPLYLFYVPYLKEFRNGIEVFYKPRQKYVTLTEYKLKYTK